MDSIVVFVDSVKTGVSNTSGIPVTLQECQANWADVAITTQICNSIVHIVVICVAGYIILTIAKFFFERASEHRKRRWQQRDREENRKTTLKDMKLDFLREFCYKETETSGGKTEKKLKAYDSENVKAYLNELG